MKYLSRFSFILLLAFSVSTIGEAQVKFGSDIYSRYIWRGVDYGNSPSIQPGLAFSTGDFTIGTWGAYSVAGPVSAFSEHDLYASYTFTTGAGSFSLLYTDYYYPGAGIKFSNFKGNGGGAHTLEAGISYTGTESFPVSFVVYNNVHNDVDKSTYLQLSYPFSISDQNLTVFAGGATAKSAWYGTSKANLINVGMTVIKSLKLSESYSLPFSASYIINPEASQSYLIVGISL